MSVESQGRRTPAPVVPLAAKVFAAFSFALALIGLVTFWPPTSPDLIIWLFLWVAVCVATAVAILRRQWVAPFLVWTLIGLALLSAGVALQSGMLDTVGIVVDIVLFVPFIWFAIWYQRSRRQ